MGRMRLFCCMALIMTGSYAVAFGQNSSENSTYYAKGEVTGRVVATAPSNPLILEQANRIPLTLSKDKIHDVEVRLYYDRPDGIYLRPPHSFLQDQNILSDADGNAYINITPTRLGRMHADITVSFADGLVDLTHFDADVVLPERQPEKLVVAIMSGDEEPNEVFPMISLVLPNQLDRIGALYPWVYYSGDPDPVPIPAEDVQFRLIYGTDNGPSISFDKATGQFKAVHLGHTMVVTTFQGLTAMTCVEVKRPTDPYDLTLCRELVPPGMKPLTWPWDNSATPARPQN